MALRDSRWLFVFRDWNFSRFPTANLDAQVMFFTMADNVCCVINNNSTANNINVNNGTANSTIGSNNSTINATNININATNININATNNNSNNNNTTRGKNKFLMLTSK